MKIKYYSTNIGVFFQVQNNYLQASPLSHFNIVEIDGQDVTNLVMNNSWYHFQGELKGFKQKVVTQSVQTGWELIDVNLASEKIPLKLTMDQLSSWYDSENEEFEYTGSHSGLRSLYREVFSEPISEIKEVEVELTKIRDLYIESYNAPAEMKVDVKEGNYTSDKIKTTDLSSIAVFADIERMLTPDFLLHTRPCSLSSQQVYKIVRAHILNNIDGKFAQVTSNYDFCFTVERVIETKPYTVKTEKFTYNLRSYRPPKFVTSTHSTKTQKIFEMTWAEAGRDAKGYGTYPIIESWSASSLQELYDNMKTYLLDLMREINKPVVECQHCNGVGHLVKPIGTNERGA